MRVVLGVGGGIAAYKAAELVRGLQSKGHGVQVVMTRAAREFIQPLTFAALTGQKVITTLFPQESASDTLASAVEHIGVAQSHDAFIVAPATADLLARFATGQADDFLTTLYLAFTGPVILAPTMNTAMWEHPATKTNLETLRARGCFVVDPDDGWLACGTVGAGRFPDPTRIVAEFDLLTEPRKDLAGEVILVTAGPTQEALDPVRYVSNRSSGKMGYAIAEAAARRGAQVTLISGPVSLPAPMHVQVISIRTAQEMRRVVLEHLETATIIIKSAAVADYFLSDVPQQKLKKTATRLSLELDPTPDILAEIGQLKGDRLLIGFAAETENLIGEARRKMISKQCDMLVANLVNQDGTGFEADNNEVDIITRSGKAVHAGPAPKKEIAERILDQVATLRLSARTENQIGRR
ncbi:MAG TPA: bifunctional phosphopantothenoylcysteine decarboxylase/phosphopantothenate--cysteine ligase CoaBC [Bryobacteraceae bacterium]|jgi:phosphopantothenoylcysteine decarboxylase/phosphopantothenate--cysteine ligase|nr:bifunctional phosphopantothenoylcysteine decarboxylase/phosphopantothenate--cysteine ligase CoaBC [Bryobacteraceae bacterium]